MMRRMIFSILFLFTSSLMARDVLPSYDSKREILLRSNYKFEGKRTKVYDDTVVRNFEIYCGNWYETTNFSNEMDSLKECSGISKGNRFYAEMKVFKKGPKLLSEKVYSVDGHLIYIIFVEGGRYSIERYESGRLLSEETWCDTVSGQGLCLFDINVRKNSIKPDSLGLFLTEQIRYVWDEKGRLKQRIRWELGNPYGLNGTYEFIYKSPCDPVQVVPEDREMGWDAMLKGRYDGSFGKIPEMGDPEYEKFAKDPYGFPSSGIGPHDKTPEETLRDIRERQKKRCEDYKKSLNKNHPAIKTE